MPRTPHRGETLDGHRDATIVARPSRGVRIGARTATAGTNDGPNEAPPGLEDGGTSPASEKKKNKKVFDHSDGPSRGYDMLN